MRGSQCGDHAIIGRRDRQDKSEIPWAGPAHPTVLLLALTMVVTGQRSRRDATPSPNPSSTPSAVAKIDVDVLTGAWVRPDGGYLIVIRGVDAGGQLDAMYFNPKPLPFAKARALPEGDTLRVFLEIQAGGYAGSTYELAYDPASDKLRGTYYQAVARQKYQVEFARKVP